MIEILCQCDGLPAHRHVLDFGPHDGVVYGKATQDIDHFVVDWKALARQLWAEAVCP